MEGRLKILEKDLLQMLHNMRNIHSTIYPKGNGLKEPLIVVRSGDRIEDLKTT